MRYAGCSRMPWVPGDKGPITGLLNLQVGQSGLDFAGLTGQVRWV
jgi:hypothetical protein